MHYVECVRCNGVGALSRDPTCLVQNRKMKGFRCHVTSMTINEFRKEFTLAHTELAAVSRLESTAYFQKGRPLDEYLDEFQDLLADSGYTDPKTAVIKFRRGLNTQIQNAIATMVTSRPSDTDPEGWYSMARTVDQNRAANEAFGFSHRTPAPAPVRPTGAFFNWPLPPQRFLRGTHTVFPCQGIQSPWMLTRQK
jgi:hypothetical protein